ncbi:50S ribosomal protein L11 methyltransferase [Marinibacterium profundimaris]|uniref:Ribosomal protein L11 methyltransferase n=1 Tax=Marinibacterium profundimaris TaxID=1679460 RepID=A0A225NKI5_9RHOB|nr:50S ribosomal protein L11 methyltransferase [Marinibacterium profundimaris]OWU72472.1 ribosomal protein L11 methyltransferase [Marinibacterium profundimaris]
MPTFTALTTLTGRKEAEALGEAMERLDPEPTGVGVFELEDGSGLWEVGGYFTESPDAAGLALLAQVFGAKPFAVSELPETDWVAKVRRELSPVAAGRFFVHGSHDSDKVPDGVEALLIDAAMAFGTGHHGTTLGCLKALDWLIEQGEVKHNVADIGCGTAVLAMAAARTWPEDVLASDIDPVAVEVAEANARANGLEGRLHCVEAAGFDHPALAGAAPFDLIFANILKGPLMALAPDLCGALAPGGHAILSGILVEQADDVVAEYSRFGTNLQRRDDIGDWTTLILIRTE